MEGDPGLGVRHCALQLDGVLIRDTFSEASHSRYERFSLVSTATLSSENDSQFPWAPSFAEPRVYCNSAVENSEQLRRVSNHG